MRSSEIAVHDKSIVARAFEIVVIASETKTECSRELVSGLPSNTRTEHHSITVTVDNTEIATKVDKQREFLSDGATNIADVRFKIKLIIGAKSTNVHKGVVSTQSQLPLIVDHVTNFRGKFNSEGAFFGLCTDATADPNLCVS